MKNDVIVVCMSLALGACTQFDPHEPRDPLSFAIELNDYGGRLSIGPWYDDQDFVCHISPDGLTPFPEAPDCRNGVNLPERLLPIATVNSEEGMRFGMGFGSGGWTGWQIRARCAPEPCTEGNYANLVIDQAPNIGGAQFDTPPFIIENGVLSLNTIELGFVAAGFDLDNVASFPMGLERGGYMRATVIYPAVYQVFFVQPGSEVVPVPGDGSGATMTVRRVKGSFLGVLAPPELYWAAPMGCNQGSILNCPRQPPSGVKACISGLDCPAE